MENQFNTLEELYAVIIGVLGKEEGKIVSSKFNKVINEYGLDKVSVAELKDIVNDVRENSYLNDLKNQALDMINSRNESKLKMDSLLAKLRKGMVNINLICVLLIN